MKVLGPDMLRHRLDTALAVDFSTVHPNGTATGIWPDKIIAWNPAWNPA